MDAAISGAPVRFRKGACGTPDERAPRTAKSCGPGAATLAPSRWSNSSATGARKAASPGRARISRKAIARGKPGCPGCTCGLTRVHFCSTPTHTGLRAQSAPGFPCALCQREGHEDAKPGRKPAAGRRTYAHVAVQTDLPSRHRCDVRHGTPFFFTYFAVVTASWSSGGILWAHFGFWSF
jgi:hypothetical protein